jgi:hypothetical protein
MKHLLLLKVKPLKCLDITLELPKLVVSLEKVCEYSLHLRKEISKASGLRKVIERDPTWSWPCE